MDKIDINEITNNLFQLVFAFEKKLVKPSEQIIKENLSPFQFASLFTLRDKSMSRNELACELGISKQQLTPIIDKLLDCEFIMREQDTIDKRSIILSITNRGKEFLSEQESYVSNYLKVQISKLDNEDLIALGKSLTELHQVIEKL